ncbi:MAG: RNA polymerase sigma-32 factor [Bdellovibrio sp. ArHS]|uniref:sigma-70 family RNA polymerase sigma factor n=1 Tax=Bdellovibrio sp. ArHS TaxID=1569284 RepID=UPI0005827F1C|nr:RNA polymerase factor sigma-32 [Bdellovibrio sp. ArHS]KHD89135.1 MAG: RNA polymerase sigma-32 factor [Bdellovibrio sp. ArHS]
MAKTKARTPTKEAEKKSKVAKKASSGKAAPAKKGVEPKSVVAEIVEENSQEEIHPSAEAEKAYAVEPPAEDFDFEVPQESKAVTVGSSKSITSSDPLVMYLNEIRRYKVLTKEEELVLAKKYFEGKDPAAAEALVKANLRFVVKVAAEYSKFGAKMIDLIQEGNVGLMHAVREFNPYKGARLITYAVWWIRGYIQEFLMRQYSMVRIGTTQNQRKLFYQLQKEKEALDAMGIEPNAALISSRLGIPEDEVRDMAMRMSGRDVSLDRPIDDESGTSLGDLQKNTNDQPLDEMLAKEEQLSILKQKIEEIRPELSDREKIILDERILNDDPLTLQEIGEKYKITREAVRQMEVRLLKKIKAKMEEDLD